MPTKRRARSTGRQMTLTELAVAHHTVERRVDDVERLSTKVYRRTKAPTILMTEHNRRILELAQHGVTERAVVEKLGMKPRLARIELKYLEKLGLVK